MYSTNCSAVASKGKLDVFLNRPKQNSQSNWLPEDEKLSFSNYEDLSLTPSVAICLKISFPPRAYSYVYTLLLLVQ